MGEGGFGDQNVDDEGFDGTTAYVTGGESFEQMYEEDVSCLPFSTSVRSRKLNIPLLSPLSPRWFLFPFSRSFHLLVARGCVWSRPQHLYRCHSRRTGCRRLRG
jgi:hypothetical protein